MRRVGRLRIRAASSTSPNRPDPISFDPRSFLRGSVLSRVLDTYDKEVEVMRKFFVILLVGVGLLALVPPARAQVEKVELDVAGYLCGL